MHQVDHQQLANAEDVDVIDVEAHDVEAAVDQVEDGQ